MEFARLFAESGYHVILVARRKDRLEALAAELMAKHEIQATCIAADLSTMDAPRQIYETVQANGQDVDVLVNNAGLGSHGLFQELDTQKEINQIHVNVVSLAHLTSLFLPAMVARKSGRILNIGSTAGFQPGPYMATYYATKAFVNSFSEALSVELRGTGVTVTVSCPGPVATEFAAVAGNEKTALFTQGGVADARSIAQEAFDATTRGESMIVHGALYKMLVQGLRVLPRSVVASFTQRANRPA